MIWRFSDGTTVELGGNVEGPTLLAQRLRADIEKPLAVNIWPPPGGDVPLDPNDPAILDAWLQSELAFWRDTRKLSIRLERPDGIPPLPPPPWAGRSEEEQPGTVY
jgi:hypothetical protein